MTFADRLKALRAKAGLTQSQLAEASGLSLGVIQNYEHGTREPTLRSAVKLADALGVDYNPLADARSRRRPNRRPGRARQRRTEPFD